MRVRLIIAQLKCRYPGEYAPNVMDSWDEYMLDENYAGFEASLKTHADLIGSDYEAVTVLDIIVPNEAIDAAFAIPTTKVEVL